MKKKIPIRGPEHCQRRNACLHRPGLRAAVSRTNSNPHFSQHSPSISLPRAVSSSNLAHYFLGRAHQWLFCFYFFPYFYFLFFASGGGGHGPRGPPPLATSLYLWHMIPLDLLVHRRSRRLFSAYCFLFSTTKNIASVSGYSQDYFTNKVCSAGKSDRRRYVTQENPLRSSEWGFKIGCFPNIYDDFCTFSCFSLDTEDRIF